MKKQIHPETVEWSNVDYQLQLTTGKSSIKIINMFKYEDQQYDANKNWQDASVNVTDFSKDYCRQVLDHSIPLEDVIFYAGHVNIHRYASQPYKIFTFFLAKVNLGLVGKPETPQVEDCDSVMIHPEAQDQAFQYNFFLKTHQQYFIKYEISFTISDDKDFKLTEFQCSNCQNRTPTIFCSTQKLYFCEDCCSDHHKTKLMHTHILEQIDKVNTLPQCKNHNQKFEFYCLKCEKYLCQYCTQKGVHHQNIQHPIKPIDYLYEETMENIQVLPKKPLEKIQVLLYNLKIKRKEVDDNFKEVRDIIVQEYEKSLKILDMEVAKKYQLLTSCEIQLQLLKDKIQWGQSFAIFQHNTLKPINYFQSEQRYESELKKLKISDFEPIFTCKPDIIYEGDVKIGPRDLIDRLRRSQADKASVDSSKQLKNNQSKNEDLRFSTSHKNSWNDSRNNIFAYNPNAVPPKRGQLSLLLQNSNLRFFQIKSK